MKTYPARCGVCGREYDYSAEFLSAPCSYADGRIRVNCPGAHTREEIQAAWQREGPHRSEGPSSTTSTTRGPG